MKPTDINKDKTLVGVSGVPASFAHNGMAVAPCSMKTLAAGYADNLLTRSCDVCLKEKRPLGLIHLENMIRAARAGAVILLPSPSFYTFAQTMDDLADTAVSRILDHLGAGHDLTVRWAGQG